MPWEPEDWEGWLPRTPPEAGPATPCACALDAILRRMPDGARMRALDLGRDHGPQRARLRGGFGQVVGARLAGGEIVESEPATGRSGATPGRDACPRFDLVVGWHAFDDLTCPEFDRVLAAVLGRLHEGGVLLAVFRSSPAADLFEMALAGDGATTVRDLHIVELQYRLHRAHFQGLRLRPFPETGGGGGVVLAMAVRRAFN